jgi:hypothetical protein
MRSSTALIAIAACAMALSAQAAESGEVFAGVGSTGLELGYAYKLGADVGVRADVQFLSLGRDLEKDGASYDAKLKFSTLGVYGDYFFGSVFRVTGGALLGTRKVSGTGVATSGTITINGTTYPAAGESITLDAKFPGVSPYLGLGLGHGQASEGLGMYFDAGVALGRAKAKLTPSAGLLTAAGQANIDAEQAKVQDNLDKLRAYPVVKIGVTYNF